MTKRRVDYSGEKVSVGIDVHKNSYAVTFVSGDVDGIYESISMPADPHLLLKTITRRYPGALVSTAYEAGFSGFGLHRILEAAGIRSLVVHAAAIESSFNNRVKTDKRDSRKIASLLHCGRLKSIRIPTLQEELKRLYHRTRSQLVRQRTQIKNQAKMRLFQFSYPVPRLMTRKVLQALTEGEELETELRMAFGALLAVYEALQTEIQRIEKILKQQSKTDPRVAVYHSIPGFGHCNTHVLATELGDMSQFRNERTLFSFLGLTPSESSSGEGKDRRGHITRQGNPQLRAILIQAAWTAVRTDAYWHHVYNRMTPRTGGKKAIVGIARRLTGVARSLFRKNELYQQQPIPGQAIAAAA